jgi:hypothetical protein
VTVKVFVAVLPAASEAVIVITFAPAASEMPDFDQDAVPVATPLVELAALAQLTVDTPTLSPAVPERVIVLDAVA